MLQNEGMHEGARANYWHNLSDEYQILLDLSLREGDRRLLPPLRTRAATASELSRRRAPAPSGTARPCGRGRPRRREVAEAVLARASTPPRTVRPPSTARPLSECCEAGSIYVVDLDMTKVGEPLDWSKIPPARSHSEGWPHRDREFGRFSQGSAGLLRRPPGRVCVLRKSRDAIRLAQEQVRGDPSHEGHQVQPSRLRFADYEIVFTTDPLFSAADVLVWYRLRQQVELVFEHFCVLAQLGARPKSDDSVKSWFYTKLLMALLVEKLLRAVSASDNVTACRSEQRQFVFDAVENAIRPPLLGVRRAQRPLTLGELGRRVRARSRSATSRPLPHGTPVPPLRQLYQDRLARLETLIHRCA